jgi:hypothetical protein
VIESDEVSRTKGMKEIKLRLGKVGEFGKIIKFSLENQASMDTCLKAMIDELVSKFSFKLDRVRDDCEGIDV